MKRSVVRLTNHDLPDHDRSRLLRCELTPAREESRTLETPPPNVLVKGFGDSSVDLEMRIWIRDRKNGVSNIKSAMLLRVWDKFHQHAIEILSPQRDVYLISPIDFDLTPEGPNA